MCLLVHGCYINNTLGNYTWSEMESKGKEVYSLKEQGLVEHPQHVFQYYMWGRGRALIGKYCRLFPVLTSRGPSFSNTCDVVRNERVSDLPRSGGGRHAILSGWQQNKSCHLIIMANNAT